MSSPVRCLMLGAVMAAAVGCSSAAKQSSAPSAPAPVAVQDTAPAATAPDRSTAQQRIDEARSLYEAGDHDGVLRALARDPAEWRSDRESALDGLRLQAFSQCVLKQRTACKRSFLDALAIDPKFSLSAAESGHPMWAPVFRQAKREAALHRSAPARRRAG